MSCITLGFFPASDSVFDTVLFVGRSPKEVFLPINKEFLIFVRTVCSSRISVHPFDILHFYELSFCDFCFNW